ncbi:MAG TPA: cytochrome c biogenesis protein ResB [Nakamurella sp.]|nr:cytochrome c biogenesis protein ResB [Nakamurella sp.]
MTVRGSTQPTDADLEVGPDTGPTAGTPPPTGQGLVGRLLAAGRNIWRQLTSMRVALILLFLLALASLPGALLPQWSLNSAKTAQYLLDYPTLGPILDRLGFFEVFASPWYAAIYLALFLSLIGCVLPRSLSFIGQLRMPPVATPRNLSRLPHHHRLEVDGSPQDVADRIRTGLRGWRVAQRSELPAGARRGIADARGIGAAGAADDAADGDRAQPVTALTISAEKGYLREVGNLVFHLSLLGLLIAIAVGKLVGYEGSVIVNAGSQFCSTSPASYDNFRPGLLVDGTQMVPFCVDVQNFHAAYTDRGEATEFAATVRYQSGADAGTDTWNDATLQVNDPLRMDGERLYLLGHGFSPHFQITYPDGSVRDYAEQFAPEPNDPNFTSEGAVKVTDPPGVTGDDIRKHQLAIVGIFAPTALLHGGIMTSSFPAANDPGVAIDVYRGDLGMEGGRSQSIFSIDTSQVDKGALVKQARKNLMVGESVTLDDGTRIAFTGYNEWVSLQTSFDPAQVWALVWAVLLLSGLMVSLIVKRRRVWFRLRAAGPDDGVTGPRGTGDRTVVEIGGLARTDQAGYGEEFSTLTALPERGRR